MDINKITPENWHLYDMTTYVTEVRAAIARCDAETARLREAGKAAYILIREQLDNMDDEDAEEVMNNLHEALSGGAA